MTISHKHYSIFQPTLNEKWFSRLQRIAKFAQFLVYSAIEGVCEQCLFGLLWVISDNFFASLPDGKNELGAIAEPFFADEVGDIL